MVKNIRIGNIEFRENQGGEIVEWYPNPYYGKKSEYKYDEKGEAYYKEEGCYLHYSCFEGKENCYVIAFVCREGGFSIQPVGIRPWKLNEQNTKDFTKIVNTIYNDAEEDDEI